MSKPLSIGIFHDGLSIPAKEGITVHALELAGALATTPDVRVTLFAADRGRVSTAELARQPFDTVLLPPDEYYDRSAIAAVLREYPCDIVQNYNSYYIASVLGPVADDLSLPLLAEHHDLEADLSFLHGELDDAAFQQSMQQLATEYADKSRVMSFYDFEKLKTMLPSNLIEKVFCMPVCLGKDYAPSGVRGTYSQTVLFIGNMSYLPNKEAAVRIVERLAPHMPECTFLMVGRESRQLARHVASPNVELAGEVDDLGTVLVRSAIGLAPITQGSGMKIKIITYLAAGLPVVATELALRGFPPSNSLIGVSDDDTQLIKAIRQTIADQKHWERLSTHASELYQEYFELKNVLPKLLTEYRRMVSDGRHHFTGRDIGMPDMRRFPWHRELRGTDQAIVTETVYIRGEA